MKYYVYSTETVYYITEVEAENEEEAKRKIIDLEVETGDATDGENFEVINVELIS